MKKLIICLVVFAGACSSFRGPEKIDPANFSLQLARTECFGKCPVYTVNVQADGKVQFFGMKNTKITGTAEDTLSREKLDELAAEINKADIFAFKDAYTPDSGNCPSKATDNPTVKLLVESGQKRKAIDHYHGCLDRSEKFPPGLAELEDKIDRIIGTERWIK